MAKDELGVIITEHIGKNKVTFVATMGTEKVGHFEAVIEGNTVRFFSSHISSLGALKIDGFMDGTPLSTAFNQKLNHYAESHGLKVGPPVIKKREGGGKKFKGREGPGVRERRSRPRRRL